jgi:hypothetical protein
MGDIVYSFAESSTFKVMNRQAFVKGKDNGNGRNISGTASRNGTGEAIQAGTPPGRDVV